MRAYALGGMVMSSQKDEAKAFEEKESGKSVAAWDLFSVLRSEFDQLLDRFSL